jgi:hypothetical protein
MKIIAWNDKRRPQAQREVREPWETEIHNERVGDDDSGGDGADTRSDVRAKYKGLSNQLRVFGQDGIAKVSHKGPWSTQRGAQSTRDFKR